MSPPDATNATSAEAAVAQASQRRIVALVGTSAAPFRDGLADAVTTPWEVVVVPDEVTRAADVVASAEAAITVRYDRGWPSAPKLRLIQVPGAGYDGIDLDAVASGIAVCNVFEHEPGVSEFALLAMLEWCHRLCRADHEMRNGDWSRSSRFGGAPDDELSGKTLVIVGLGRIGSAVARRARAFDMRVLAVNRTATRKDRNVERVAGLDALRDTLAQADFVVLACALAPETRGLIDAAAFDAMKPTAVIVNVARGPVIDEAALFSALSERRIGGAAIDTWWEYPADAEAAKAREPSVAFPFHELDNVLLSPHVAGWTTGTLLRRTREMAKNLDRLARGERLVNVVR